MISARMFRRACVALFATSLFMVFVGDGSAWASGVWWGLTSGSWPASLPAGGSGKVVVTAENLGSMAADASSTPVVVEDSLPAGVTVQGVSQVEGVAGENKIEAHNRGPVVCSSPSAHRVRCEFAGVLPSYEEIEVRIGVLVAPGAVAGEQNVVTASGGGGAARVLERPLSIGSSSVFGVEDYSLTPEEAGGAMTTQAGGHPFQLTTVVAIDTSEAANDIRRQEPAALTKDLTFDLPPGLVGNPTPLPQCTEAQFTTQEPNTEHDECEARTAIGAVTATYNVPNIETLNTRTVPLFNLPPLVGEPARFGFEVGPARVTLDTSVRTGGDYGVTVSVSNIQQLAGFLASKVTFWGVPGDPSHDGARGWKCVAEIGVSCGLGVSQPPPFLTMPTSCSTPMHTSVRADSWAEPHPASPFEAPLFFEERMGTPDGCDHLQFDPTISVAPDVPDGSTPTGLAVNVHVPQTAELNAESLAESALRNTTVALPQGVAVNAAGADGLEACSTGDIGYLGRDAGEPDTTLFTPGLSSPFCPDESKIGTVELETPLLANTLKGAVYLAAQNQNPFGSLIAMYLVAEDPVSGTLLKLAGNVSLDPASGQVTATFTNTPPLPFENLRLHFFGEGRAPLGTPARCGSYTTNATLAPWSGNEPSRVTPTFDIASGPNGAACADPLPFAPSLKAGTTSIQAAGFSPLTVTMSREDGNQPLGSVRLQMPSGLSGLLSGVALCAEAQANEGTCGPGSLIGETTVGVGLGANPFTVTGGRVYLTGPYEGAPFGLSIVNPAKAGPFDVERDTAKPATNMPACDCIVVRAKIEVDPVTAALTVTSDPPGSPHSIPTILDGIPLQIKHVNVTIDRPDFTFNPTDCEKTAIVGGLTSSEGATSVLPVPFQVTNCARLAFKPSFSVSTSGKTSRKNGASLHVKLSYPDAPFGTQANIRYVKVALPRQLPSRLETLQKACTDKVFDVNPANCPAASRIGTATTTTPILPVPLTGPVYFVSHAAVKFPDLVAVLQGYGVTVDLRGETFIAKGGQTSTTFRTIPDAPVGVFELELPQGPFSALAAPTGVCKAKLVMPTAMIAQNGATFKQNTRIKTIGCPKAKPKKKKGKRKK